MASKTSEKDLIKSLRDSLARGVAALRHVQRSDGHWCAELEGDSILESEYILMKFILGQENEPFRDGVARRLEQIANGLRIQQRPSGEGGIQARHDMSTVRPIALKLMGDDPEAPHMARAREVIRQNGGAERCNTFSMFFLARRAGSIYGYRRYHRS